MSNQGTKTGKFVISLDFELLWGMFDKVSGDDYLTNLKGVPTVVPKTLELFQQYNIHATWATVGMLMADDKNDLKNYLPDQIPKYFNKRVSAYRHLEQDDFQPELHFAPKLVEQILTTPNQELASHTFSHFYCAEPMGAEGSSAAFSTDCAAQVTIMQKFNITPVSIVFPRNQITKQALAVASASSIKTYRGNEQSLLYKNGSSSPLWIRALRLIDSYFNLTGHHTHKPEVDQNLINIPASRFLRPYNKKLSFLEKMKIRRIKKAMTYAAKHSEIFHLWWHPHNFGVNQTANFQQLEEILKHFISLQKQYEMESLNMAEFIPSSEQTASNS